MPRYVTTAQVRAACGITTKFISDSDFDEIISDTEYEVERIANTSFIPRTVIEQYEGNGTERLVLINNPVLKIRALNIDGTDITPEYVRVDKQPGVIWLTTSAEEGLFKSKSTERNLVRIKYDSGLLVYTTTQTTTTAATVAGDSVAISVSSESGFAADDYVEVQGMDSQIETAKITSTATGTITVDTLAVPHESDSMVTKVDVPDVAKRLMRVAGSLAGVARVVGQSFDEITGYTLGDESVQKGEPYTQWRETAAQLRKEWDQLWKSFRTRPSVR